MAFASPSPSVLDRILEILSSRERNRRGISSYLEALGTSDSTHETAGLFCTSVGSSSANQSQNRYNDIIAYDSTRIIPSSSSNYVNASLIVEPNLGISPSIERRHWVAAQAPLQHTIHAFLTLLLISPTADSYPSDSTPLPLISMIIQVTSLVEGGRKKCEKYFPEREGEEWSFEEPNGKDLPIQIKLVKKELGEGIRTSWLEIGRVGESRRAVRHFEYLDWGDHGIPNDPIHLVKFTLFIQQLNATFSTNTSPSPILVHCSAGVGRTGTFISLASLLPLVALYKIKPPTLLPLLPPPSNNPLPLYPSIHDGIERDFIGLTVDGLRDQRTTMVQTESQLRFLFEAVKVSFDFV